MSPETFLANFGHLADAPNGVQKLRELILQLAVQGRLVPQDPKDEPASVLLERITAEKRRLEREGKIQKSTPLPPISPDEVPYTLPQTWVWERLGAVVAYNGAPKVDPQSIPNEAWILELEDIEKDTSRILQRLTFRERQSRSTKARFSAGDVLYGKLRPYLNKVVVADDDGFCTTEIVPLKPLGGFGPRYLLYALKRPDFLAYVNARSYGMKMPRLGSRDGELAIVPVPPLLEQRRIVDNVDHLMALCDELESQHQQRTEQRARLNSAALHRLTTAHGADELERAWERVREHFDLLCDVPETVGELRQAILQLAVRGKLVPQDPDDEPASVLLEKIAPEKRRLEREGKIRKSKVLPPINADEVPFGVPAGWEWAYIDNLCDVAGGIQKTPQRRPRANAFPYLRVANVQRGRLELGEIEYFELFDGELEKWRLEPGDLLVVEGNGSETEIGRCAIWNGEIESCVHQNHLIRCRPIETQLSAFLLRYLNSPAGMAEMKRLAITTSGLYNLSVGKIRGIAVPVPPLAEQQRIVGRLVQLLVLCDELESKLTRARTRVEHFASSVVHHLTAA